MQDQNQKIIVERFNSLPQKIKDAITNSDWEQKIRLIARQHNLVIGDAYILETNTLLIMLGIIDYDKYFETLKQELNISEDQIKNIVFDVNEQIFDQIKYELQIMNDIDKEKGSEQLNPNDNSIEEFLLKKEAENSDNIERTKIAEEIKDHVEIIDEQSEEPIFQSEKISAPTETVPEEINIQKQDIKKLSDPMPPERQKLPDPYREQIN